MALGLKLNGSGSSVFTLMGDGECQEGQVWEAAMFAAHKGLDNLVAIVDHNHLQIDGRIETVCSPEDLGDKFRSFGCRCSSATATTWKPFSPRLKALRNLAAASRA